MPSFDVVSELDKHELTNAVDNAIKELDRRFDLKGKCSFEAKDKSVTLTAEADFMLEQMLDILRSNLVKRKVDSQCMEIKDAYPSGKVVKQDVNFREGIDKDLAKKIVGLIKERKLKVQAAIQGEQVASPARSVTICRRPSPCCAANRSACRCSSPTSAIDEVFRNLSPSRASQ